MKISLIVAAGIYNEIGAKNELLWHLPADMAYFKKTTLGHHILMGRKTYDSIPKAFRPLSGRTNLIITSSGNSWNEAIQCFTSPYEAIEAAQQKGEKELFIIGGAQIYAFCFTLAHRIYLTRVDAAFPEADTFFPEIDYEKWSLTDSSIRVKDEKNKYDLRFEIWDRILPKNHL